jgi:hypothetical protein
MNFIKIIFLILILLFKWNFSEAQPLLSGWSDKLIGNWRVVKIDSIPLAQNIDMFLEFYAYPFNPLGGIDLKVPNQVGQQLKIGTSIFGSVNSSGNYLGERKSTRRPQIIHLTATTPTSAVTLYDCGTLSSIYAIGLGTNPCTQLNPTTPCPNPEDFRIFSISHYVRTIPLPQQRGPGVVVETTTIPPTTTTTTTRSPRNVPPIGGIQCFDPDWTDMISSTEQNGYFLVSNDLKGYKLPITITIIANGCVYRKKDFVNIYPNYLQNPGVYGSADCNYNPTYRELGFSDFITVS